MNEDVGYGRPPVHSRYPKGLCGNRKGRPKRPLMSADQILRQVLSQPVTFRENGEEKTTSWPELVVRSVIHRAIEGDVKAAKSLLRLRVHADKYGDPGVLDIHVEDWLPDFPGQTAEQKMQGVTSSGPKR